ncbi:MAG: undecaprenyldiphospho-muramoylpentapeptide beta-N-acetylglucosaminyltransferase [Anaerolineae bacterium]|jgi:UDP-N-acetylglucosamine--N-acetylmuramyl-(pentapeptide) pyrophosphoryl-undecaprenol N-acetylglucosamine transferase
MKLVVSGGGTGGHVYPALTVINTLCEPKPAGTALPTLTLADLRWIGSRGGIEEDLVERAGIQFIGLAAGGLRGMGFLVKIRNTLRILGSVGRARVALVKFEPDAVLVTGGYACVAVTLAAWLQWIPVVIYLPDIVPGLAIRFLSRFAAKVTVTSEESYHFFKREKVVVTGYPVRPDIYDLDRDSARRGLGLDSDSKTLLVFGGSRGARSINQALVAGLRELLPACQIVHVSGRLDADWVAGMAKSLPEALRGRYHHYAYLHDMPQALAAADLAVSRAGAATMGEFPAARLPAILVPYPHSGQHQDPNAAYMARNGAAEVLADSELEGRLVPKVLALLRDEEMLAEMRESAHAMARPDAAEAIAGQLWFSARQRALRASADSGGGEGGKAQP